MKGKLLPMYHTYLPFPPDPPSPTLTPRAREAPPMMVAIILAMAAALVLAHLGRPVPARIAAGIAFALAVHLFLWEIHSPEYGFRMPWIDTRLDVAGAVAA